MIRTILAFMLITLLATFTNPAHGQQDKKPNILVIWGDDIGVHNVSAYNHGIMGYRTPNIDRLAQEGALLTDAYAQQSCTAGRASFILGEHPFRTGLLTIGMPGSEHGIPDWAPTIADLLKGQGYTTGQFGKNHLGDRDKHLPTAHGFDEFFGNLYHLNARRNQRPTTTRRIPNSGNGTDRAASSTATRTARSRTPARLRKSGWKPSTRRSTRRRGSSWNNAVNQKKPFFIWFNTTRMHVWTHLSKEYLGKTGVGLYPDGMVEHDDMVGGLLKKLDDLKKPAGSPTRSPIS